MIRGQKSSLARIRRATVANNATTSSETDPPTDVILTVELPVNVSVMALALTPALGLKQSPQALQLVRITGVLTAVDSPNTATDNQTIAYVCCDAGTTPSSNGPSPDSVLNSLMDLQTRPKAILLYSLVGDYCSLGGTFNYQSILTMKDADSARQLLRYIDLIADGATEVLITGNATAATPDMGSDSGGNGRVDVAMSLLYTFTALVTILFIAVVATGALRAHRYPERYGPRSGRSGGGRQSRAKGLARAVLDTIPIVKFRSGPREQEVKLANVPGGAAAGHEVNNLAERDGEGVTTDVVGEPDLPVPAGADGASQATVTNTVEERAVRDAGQPTVVVPWSDETAAQADAAILGSRLVPMEAKPAESDQRPGCSICTDDFTDGEDVRVLPCDHKYHPACVDPWLVNVSGTCPLCRLDLSRASTKHRAEGNTTPTSPIGLDGETEDGDSVAVVGLGLEPRRRRSRLLDWSRLRDAPQEERMATLRRLGTEQRRGGTQAEAGGRAGVAAWLRDKMQVQTRTQASRPGREV